MDKKNLNETEYNDFIDTVCQVINDDYENLDEEQKKVVIWRLNAFVQGKHAPSEFKEKLLDVNLHYLYQRLSTKERVYHLLAFSSLCFNDQLDYQNFTSEQLAFLGTHVSKLNKDQEEAFAVDYCSNDIIPLLCDKVKNDEERSFYLRHYQIQPMALRQNLMEASLEEIRKDTGYYLEDKNTKEQAGGYYHNGSRRF